jgi:hypothetical protein
VAYAVALSRRDAAPPAPAGPVSGQGTSVVVGSAPGCVVPSALPASALGDALPAGLTMPPGSRLVAVTRDEFGTTVVGDAPGGINALHAAFRQQLVAGGLEIFAEDNEGVESELFFTDRDGRIGAIRQTRARCPAGVTRFSVNVL